MTARLPVHEVLPALRDALREGRNAVLEAPPGAGKSTVVPLVLLEEPWAHARRILLLEPRRLAARAVAARMASTLGEPVGATVGYRMRLDTRVGPQTRLEVITEGVLTRMLQRDAALEGVAAVVFDEFHERSLQADLGLALALESQQFVSPDLRLLLMSATLDGERVARLLGDAPRIRAAGRTHEVTIHYVGRGLPPLPQPGEPLGRFIDTLAVAVRSILAETRGDVLMFLPGVPEIRRLREVLESSLREPGLELHELSGELALERQEAAIAPAAPGRRKLVLSTNVAETSLTIEGVRVVIDSGLQRRSVFDPGSGMSSLVTQRVSQSSATQRAGRAGRVAAGDAYRLWSEGAQPSLAPQSLPEVATADLAPLALELAAWGADATQLRWLDEPSAAGLAQARELLAGLDALDVTGRITAHGREMAAVGTHPRLAHLLLRARAIGQGRLAARLVALLSERDVLRGERDPDLRTRLEAVSAGRIDRATLARLRRQVEALDDGGGSDESLAGRLLAWAFPDRIAQRRGGEVGRYLLSGGRGAMLREASTLGSSEYLVAVDLDDADAAAARIRLAIPLTTVDIESALGSRIVEVVESGFDGRTQAVQSRRVRRLGSVVLSEQAMPMDALAMTGVLIGAIRSAGLHVLPWSGAAETLRARLRFVAGLPGESGNWPPVDDSMLLARLEEWLAPFAGGISRLSQLGRIDLAVALRSLLDYESARRLDQLAPVHLLLPTGTRAPVDYLDDNAPCIEARMQEVFGLADTPRVGGGRVPVTLKLLSPARRPMQITRDLAGFWRGSYAEVRKEMRGRYPRHYWPENPLEAEPTRGIRRR